MDHDRQARKQKVGRNSVGLNNEICVSFPTPGADINKQNLSGETVLHYVYAYGFEELGEYLKSKGADDTLTNIDGLTCYEGLHVEDVESL